MHIWYLCRSITCMAITIIILALAGLGLFIYLGFKGTKNGNNKPPEGR